MKNHSIFYPLSNGKYNAYSSMNKFQVAFNGGFSGDAIAICKDKWVKFYQNDKEVFSCNPVYANANFKCTKIKEHL